MDKDGWPHGPHNAKRFIFARFPFDVKDIEPQTIDVPFAVMVDSLNAGLVEQILEPHERIANATHRLLADVGSSPIQAPPKPSRLFRKPVQQPGVQDASTRRRAGA